MRLDIIDIGEEDVRKKVEDILKNRSRDQRYHLHKHFQKFKTLEEAKQNKPARLTQENWDDLCAYWSSPNVQVCITLMFKLKFSTYLLVFHIILFLYRKDVPRIRRIGKKELHLTTKVHEPLSLFEMKL